MFSASSGPPRPKRTPLNGPDLHVHPQHAGALGARERWLVAIFLRRYVVWLARRRRIDAARNALDLLVELTTR